MIAPAGEQLLYARCINAKGTDQFRVACEQDLEGVAREVGARDIRRQQLEGADDVDQDKDPNTARPRGGTTSSIRARVQYARGRGLAEPACYPFASTAKKRKIRGRSRPGAAPLEEADA